MKKVAIFFLLAMSVAACVTINPYYRLGTNAEINKQYDMAIKYYEKAALENPKEAVYRLALARAKSAATLFHIDNARTLAAQGKKKEALGEYALALFYEPLSLIHI